MLLLKATLVQLRAKVTQHKHENAGLKRRLLQELSRRQALEQGLLGLCTSAKSGVCAGAVGLDTSVGATHNRGGAISVEDVLRLLQVVAGENYTATNTGI